MKSTLTVLALAAGLQLVGSPAGAQAGCSTDTTGKKADPFSFADFTWLNGNSRTTDSPIATSYFTGEFQLQQLGIGGDFHCGFVRARLMTQLGMYSTMTPRNDASPGRGQWQLDNAYRYLSEAYGGYHWDKWNGINLDVGIF